MIEGAQGAPAHEPAPEAPARRYRVWDPLVRIVHWGVALGVGLNAAVLDEDGSAHEVVGYAVASLVILRLVWGLIGPRHARFRAFPPAPAAALRQLASLLRPGGRVYLSHNPAGALMAYNLWASLLAMAATGWMMETPRYFGLDWVEELHEAVFVWLMVSVGLHLVGVILDSLHSGVPLIRAMIDGHKVVPRGREVR